MAATSASGGAGCFPRPPPSGGEVSPPSSAAWRPFQFIPSFFIPASKSQLNRERNAAQKPFALDEIMRMRFTCSWFHGFILLINRIFCVYVAWICAWGTGEEARWGGAMLSGWNGLAQGCDGEQALPPHGPSRVLLSSMYQSFPFPLYLLLLALPQLVWIIGFP